jgi:transcriptional regulator with XRE-family HTH domain
MEATAPGHRLNTALPYLRQWREYKRLTREELAFTAKVSVATIAKLELGDSKAARKATVDKIAKALGLGWKLLRDTPPPADDQ